MPLTGVTFDLWQTLIVDKPELGRGRMKVRIDGTISALDEIGIRLSLEQVNEAYRRCSRACQEIRAQERDISFMEQIECFIRCIDPNLIDQLESKVVQRIATGYADSLFSHPPPLHPDAVNVLKSLKERGYKLGLISNTGMTPGFTFRKYMDQVGILGYFDTLIFSDEVRLAKPSVEIFFLTAREIKVSPEELIHVGDDLQNDVFVAHNAGLKTIWVKTETYPEPDIEVRPDLTVTSLGQVTSAIESLASPHD